MRLARIAAAGIAALSVAGDASAQFCPCYTASSPNNDENCAIEAVNGTNPTPAEWADIFDLVSRGPSAWGNAGPSVGDIGEGCGNPEPLHQVPARFPCELLKSIAMVESGWRQFCVPTTPSDQQGGPSRTIISFDCGYGIGQVTSGMHVGENPDFDRQKVASDPTYNLATGTRILAGKWAATNCVGDNQPTIIEDWYTATWAYNGLAYVNNPNNPNYDSDRGVYDPAVGNACPYQERVFGRIEHPTSGYWPSVPLAYPDPADCGGTGQPPDLPEPSCASPTDCANARPVHVTSCIDEPTGSGGAGGAGASTSATSAGGVTSAISATGTSASGAGVGGQSGNADADGDLHGTCSCRVGGDAADDPRAELILGAIAVVFALVKRRRRVRR